MCPLRIFASTWVRATITYFTCTYDKLACHVLLFMHYLEMPLHQIISVLSDPSQGNKKCIFYTESITKQPSLMNNERNNRLILFVNILKSCVLVRRIYALCGSSDLKERCTCTVPNRAQSKMTIVRISQPNLTHYGLSVCDSQRRFEMEQQGKNARPCRQQREFHFDVKVRHAHLMV